MKRDEKIFELIKQEHHRQMDGIELIASENFVSPQVLEAMGSVMTNKYAEGLPGARYYGGCQIVDQSESLAIERLKELFDAEWANVQPHSGAQANMAVLMTVLNPGDKFLGLDLSHGGHLSHGSPVNSSGLLYEPIAYGVKEDSGLVDYDMMEAQAIKHKPKLIIGGASAYSRDWDYARMRAIADKVGAILMIDMAHPAGLIAAGLLNNPVKYAHIVTSTTHKTLRGPRGGIILIGKDFDNPFGKTTKKGEIRKMSSLLDSSVFPGIQETRLDAIAFAIYNYVRYTGDKSYLVHFGLELLIAVARFWAQRVNFSPDKDKYVMLGVTGPNEYENNINNNWYTNLMATWCLEYADEVANFVKQTEPERYEALVQKITFNEEKEFAQWREIRKKMFFPVDEKLGIFLQQEGYMDKEQILVKDLDLKHRPINQKWSWDRILRSCFIKQADVLQGLYFLEDRYDIDTIRRNFDFYEARTVHESSLSPCVHSVQASLIGNIEKAYEFYLRTARLDLDDYNHEVKEGLHITSMAGTWISIVEGFGGMRVRNNMLVFNPQIPKQWKSYSFKVWFRENILKVKIDGNSVIIKNEQGSSISVVVNDVIQSIASKSSIEIAK